MGVPRLSHLRPDSAQMGDLRSTCFPVHPTIMIHPIIVGVSGWSGYSLPKLVGILGLCFWGRLGAGWLVCTHSRCTPPGHSNFCDVHFRMTHLIRITTRWSNTTNHAMGNIGVILCFFFALFSGPRSATWLQLQGVYVQMLLRSSSSLCKVLLNSGGSNWLHKMKALACQEHLQRL